MSHTRSVPGMNASDRPSEAYSVRPSGDSASRATASFALPYCRMTFAAATSQTVRAGTGVVYSFPGPAQEVNAITLPSWFTARLLNGLGPRNSRSPSRRAGEIVGVFVAGSGFGCSAFGGSESAGASAGAAANRSGLISPPGGSGEGSSSASRGGGATGRPSRGMGAAGGTAPDAGASGLANAGFG